MGKEKILTQREDENWVELEKKIELRNLGLVWYV